MDLQKVQYNVTGGVGVISMICARNLNAIDESMASKLLYVPGLAQRNNIVKTKMLSI